ncbi:puromycin-sensitive aminopeptidase-like protein [Cladorrhinum samala]|uniref:Puromycin-sensitive aminopeptidase-like protein n=1 Tax=Cladorrhinum samala TaxID=585594 RepID=A0AAV9HRU7_9PEZI|nr:puromycin-sensitive aminopeptidase-like protein [Cladorrhinum samala]
MVDHRSLEKEYMAKEFKAHALTEKEIAPDGHCLFSAVADQLEVHGIPLGRPGPEPNIVPYKTVRKTAAEYMQQHRDDYEAFMEEGFEEYVHKIRDTAEWGGQLELSALANAYGVEIKVVQDGRTETIAPKTLPEGDEKRTLWLAYYRRSYGLGEHYNSLRSST